MRVCELYLENFRGIKSARIPFGKNSVLIGANNCGKTSIAEALALLLGTDRREYYLSEYDFFGGNPTSESRFNIVATITDFPSNSDDPTDFPEWFHTDKAERPVWWSEKEKKVYYDTDVAEGTQLALQIGGTGFYDDDECDFKFKRFFYDGKTDPFGIDSYISIPHQLIKKLGLFLLPSSRQWDKILTFGSKTYLRLLREYGAIPGDAIQDLKEELRIPKIKIENFDPLRDLIDQTEKELKAFFFAEEDSHLVYRLTSLDKESIFKGLTPHLKNPDGSLIPLSRQGGGFISVQIFLILLAFARRRKSNNENFIFIAEEPELHLHPCLQSKLIDRIRANSDQCIFTTHSPKVASFFPPSDAIYLNNAKGKIISEVIYSRDLSSPHIQNQIRKLYLEKRAEFYDALMGKYVLLPEGEFDFHWLNLWIRIAQSCPPDIQGDVPLSLTLIPTGGTGSLIIGTFKEVRRFRDDLIVLLDNDSAGKGYKKEFENLPKDKQPKTIIQFGEEGEIEDLAAWILEEAIQKPGENLRKITDLMSGDKNAFSLGYELKSGRIDSYKNKENRDLHEKLAWEAYQNPKCRTRAFKFISDLSRICIGHDSSIQGWHYSVGKNGIRYFRADFIKGKLARS